MDAELKDCSNCYHSPRDTEKNVECSLCDHLTKSYWRDREAPAPAMTADASAPLTPPKKTSDGGSTSYYKIPEGAADLQDLIEQKNMNFSIGNIFKACYRLGEKNGTDANYDLRKIIFFAQREMARRAK